jgi:V/A-type H+-transporting ATPase subunit I
MYGLPSYNEIDPGFFLAFTYTILFGMMYGDAGHGLVLIIVGILMYKLKGMWLGKILSCIGCSSVVFGLIYGSIFGFEDILPFGFHVLEDGNTMTALYIAIGLGIVIILTCMALNMINGLKQKNVEKIFFSPNGIPGFMMFAYLGVAVLLTMYTDVNILTKPFILVFVGLPIALMFFKTPLVCLCTGQKWKPESVAMFIVESFFELFETFLSYISNVLSFLRVAAYAISHAGMMMVVFLLAETAAGGHNPVVLIIGNIIVIGLEGLLACIQALRLEFYEMFGRFYDDGGKPFKPCVIDYTKIKE